MKKPRIIFRKHKVAPREVQKHQDFDKLMNQYRGASKKQVLINTIVLAVEVVVVLLITFYLIHRFNRQSNEFREDGSDSLRMNRIETRPTVLQASAMSFPVVLDSPGTDNIADSLIEVGDEIICIVEQMPSYKGGMEALLKFIYKEHNYPKEARKKGIEGKVYVQFLVNADGSISDAKVLKGIGYGCDEEALQIVSKMPDWIPGIQAGRKVPVKFTLPIQFKLRH